MNRLHRLNFLNPVFRVGDNLTCRLGDSWFKRAKTGDVLELFRTGDHTPRCFGVVSSATFCKFSELQDDDLVDEHDPTCHTVAGLVEAMRRAYGDKFSPDAGVTMLHFRVYGWL